ncbi:Uncharacterised protein [Mycobacterium tuberculosis]|uniref:Uncharacterized protein n=1 Tax=Mycobacterium tuberculosis TaxID=1773 RepID=A0A916LE99_MYCTX|nr:Uncharacterised protein [Mycobacterium tuberculosis]
MSKPISVALPSAATPSSRAMVDTSTGAVVAFSSARPSSCCTRSACVLGWVASRDMIRAASTAAPRNISSASSANGCEPCWTQIVPANTGGRSAPTPG